MLGSVYFSLLDAVSGFNQDTERARLSGTAFTTTKSSARFLLCFARSLLASPHSTSSVPATTRGSSTCSIAVGTNPFAGRT